jgi:endonuclease/exonuclease/phosphatase family metal-dependent hydrolase
VGQIKIITINTWKCDGDYRRRITIMAEQLKLLKPDIVACQECFVSEEAKVNTLQFLAEELEMNYLFANGRSKKRLFEGKWVDSLSGLGILSIYPLLRVDTFDLPVIPEDNDRKAQQVEVCLTDGGKLLMTNVHLTHLSNAIELRKAQANFVADKTKALDNYHYKIACGDFNATPDSVEIDSFKMECTAIDCYTAGNGPEPRNTLVEALKKQKPICVDHIFALPVEDIYPNFINSAVVLNEPDTSTGIYASDHFGICTTLITD